MKCALLVVSTRRLRSEAFRAAVSSLTAAGAHVDVLTFWPPEVTVTGVDRLVVVGPMPWEASVVPSERAEIVDPAPVRSTAALDSEEGRSVTPPPRPRGFGPARITAAYTWRLRRLRRVARRRLVPFARRAGVHRYRMWLRTRRSPEALALAASADLIVTFDGPALLTVWRLAQRTSAATVNGVPAGVRALREIPARPRASTG